MKIGAKNYKLKVILGEKMKKNMLLILSAICVLSLSVKAKASLELNNDIHTLNDISIELNLKPMPVLSKIQYNNIDFLKDHAKINELENNLSKFGFEFNLQRKGQYYLLQWSNNARIKELILGEKTNKALRAYAEAVDTFLTKYKNADFLISEDPKSKDIKADKKIFDELEAKGDFSAKAYYLLVTY